jgi:hypothetical protein
MTSAAGDERPQAPMYIQIKTMTLNCCSLQASNRQQMLLQILSENDIQIAGLQETWLTSSPEWTPPPGWAPLFSSPPPTPPNSTNPQCLRGQGLAILVRRSLLRQHSARLELVSNFSNAHFQCLAATVGPVLVVTAYVYNTTQANHAFPALAHHIDSLRGEPQRPVVVLGDFNHTHAHPLLHDTMVGHLDAHPLLYNGEVTFPGRNTGPDNIFASPALEMDPQATILERLLGDHRPVVASFKQLFPAPHTHPHEAPDQPQHIRWWRLRRPSGKDNRRLAKYNKTVAAAQAEAALLLDQQEELDLESLQAAILLIFTKVLGTAPYRSEITEAWMDDPVVQDYLSLWERAVKQHDRSKTAKTATARNQALKKLRWAKTQAITKARLASIWRMAQGGDTTPFFRDQKQRRDPRTDTACPHLNKHGTVAAWTNILQRPAAQEGQSASTMPPLSQHINLAFENSAEVDEVLDAIRNTKNKSPGPGGLDARGVKVLAPVLYPLYQLLFNKALQNSLPSTLKCGQTCLIAKADKTSTDPLQYRPITTLPILTRMFHSAIDRKLRELVYERGIISESQAGFMPYRSTHRQVMILSCITALARCLGRSMHVTFLDLEKCFDTISHEDLITVMRDVLLLPLEWVEVIRRLLIDNTTTILDEKIAVTRGCMQGSPLSPLLCLFMMEDFVRYMRQHAPADLPPFLGPYTERLAAALPADVLWLLFFLLFADDVACVGEQGLQEWMIPQAQKWAELRHMRFSPKSRIMTLHCQRGRTDQGTFQLPLHDFVLQWTLPRHGSFRYLGAHLKPNPHHGPVHPRHLFTPKERRNIHYRMLCLNRGFTLPSGRRLPEPRLIAIGVKQIVHAAALYPTPVIDVDYKALDHIVFPAVRRLLDLPRDASSAFLWTELTLWPSHLLAQKRTLHFAAEFTDTWFYQEVVRRFMGTFAHFATSSLRRMMDTLRLFDKTLDDLQAPELVGDGDIDPKILWKEHVRLVAWEKGFLPLLQHKLASYPAWKYAHYRRVCFPPDTEPGLAFPSYIRKGGLHAAIGLRFKLDALRALGGKERPACLWCHAPHAECGVHLTTCPAIPCALGLELRACLTILHAESKGRPLPEDPSTSPLSEPARFEALECLARLHWEGMSSPTLLRTLTFLANLINDYRRAWRPAPDDQIIVNPIYRVSIPSVY